MGLYTKSTQNAVSILTHIAKGEGRQPHTVSDISSATGISGPTVAKTVQPLVKRGFLESRKGPGGGFILGRPAGEVTLGSIVLAIEGREPFEDCVAGLSSCSEDNLCPLHAKWKDVKESILTFLETTTLQDMVLAVCRMEEVNRASPEADLGRSPLQILPPNGPPGGGNR